MKLLMLYRGNAVMRVTAKKHSDIATEWTTVEDSENVIRDRHRSKSKVKTVLQSIIRMVRLVMMVALVNVPLYVMLLCKDWIDI